MKYMLTRSKYKEIKRFDHKQLEGFAQSLYKSGYEKGKVTAGEQELKIQDITTILKSIKGIGEKKTNEIILALIKLQEEKECL
jgi:hypothetical protein